MYLFSRSKMFTVNDYTVTVFWHSVNVFYKYRYYTVRDTATVFLVVPLLYFSFLVGPLQFFVGFWERNAEKKIGNSWLI